MSSETNKTSSVLRTGSGGITPSTHSKQQSATATTTSTGSPPDGQTQKGSNSPSEQPSTLPSHDMYLLFQFKTKELNFQNYSLLLLLLLFMKFAVVVFGHASKE
jgi:hypothetical protein